MPASGVFIYAGLTPNTELLGGLVPLDARGQIVTDLRMRTRVPGVLAAGDVARGVRAAARDLRGRRGHRALAAIQYLARRPLAGLVSDPPPRAVAEWDAATTGMRRARPRTSLPP